MPTSQNKPSAPSCSTTGFDYCFWAKLFVAIPALTLAAMLVSMQFHHVAAQIASAAACVFALVWAAKKIDRMPAFASKIMKRK